MTIDLRPNHQPEPCLSPAMSLDPAAIRKAAQERAAVFRAAETPPEQPDARLFRLLSMEEMLSEPKPTDWVIRDRLEATNLAVLFGGSGSMKTFVALDMGLCTATGLPWHGHTVPKPGPVVYIAGEGFRGLAKRIRAWILEHNADSSAIPFYVTSDLVEFLNPKSVDVATAAVADLVTRQGSPRLVVVDTLARCFGGGDENSTADMGAFVAALDRLRLRFDCAVLVVHHSGLQEQNRARGASALRAALDMEYRLDVQDNTRILICTKAKDHEAPPLLAFEPRTVPTGWIDPDTGDEIMSCVLYKQDKAFSRKGQVFRGAKQIAFKALLTCCEENGRAHVDDWRKEAYRRGISTSTDSESKGKAFRRAVRDLLDLGKIEADSDYYFPTGQPDRTGHCPDLSTRTLDSDSGQVPLGTVQPVRSAGLPPEGEGV